MKKISGFTVIELVIVITVMAILFGIGYGVYGNQKQKTAASTINNDLKTIELALDSFARADGISEWWPQSEFGSTSSTDNPTISEIQSATDLKKYLASVPAPPLDTTAEYSYDNDAEYSSPDNYNPTSCGSSDVSDGVNLTITVSASNKQAEKIFEILDEAEDDGSPSCGRITQVTGGGNRTLFYHMAIGASDYPSSIQ